MKTMERKLRFLFIDHYALNIGDMAILLGMVYLFSKVFSNSEIIIESTHPKITKKILNRYEFNEVKVIPRLIYIDKCRAHRIDSLHYITHIKNIKCYLLLLLKLFTAILASMIFKITKTSSLLPRTLRMYVNSDCIISVGGGFLNEYYGWILRTITYSLIKIFYQKPIILFCQSIGPFSSNFSKKIVRIVLNSMIDIIIIRDKKSIEWLKQMDICMSKVYLGVDCGIAIKNLMEDRDYISTKENSNSYIRVGITVRDFFKDRKSYNHFIKEISRVINKILCQYFNESRKCTLIFIPHDPSDKKMFMDIMSHLKEKRKYVRSYNYSEDPMKVINGYKNLDIVIAMRFHSIIFSAITRTPVISIACEEKSTDLMRRMGLEQYVFKLDDVMNNVEKIYYAINKMLMKENYTEVVKKIKKSVKNFEEILDICINLIVAFTEQKRKKT